MRRVFNLFALAALTRISLACSVASEATDLERAPLVGGTPDATTRSVVALVTGVGDGQQGGCSGSLLAPNLVLTARHCVASISNTDGRVDCSSTTFGPVHPVDAMLVTWDDDLQDGVAGNARFAVANVRTSSGSQVCGADLALVILRGSGIPPDVATPIVPRLDEPSRPDEPFDALGYGITDPADENGETFGKRLRVQDLRVACVGGTEECDRASATQTEWGAVSPVCGGDSGGPALDTAGRVIGVASRGDESCSGALYTHPSAYAALIRSAAVEAAESGGYSPPHWVAPAAVDAGPPDSGDEPLGESCSGPCQNDYACYSENNEPPGICVPRCAVEGDFCPAGYACSASLEACIPDQTPREVRKQDRGCSLVTGPAAPVPPATLTALSLLAIAARQRRIRRKS